MSLNGTDVSAYQPGNPNFSGNTFGWAKATEGVGWESPVWREQITELRSLRDGAGYYHLANGLNTPQAEAQYFWGVIKGFWQVGEPVALDAEPEFYSRVADPVGWSLAFAQEIKRLSALTSVFYSDWDHLKNHGYNFQPLVDFNMGLWGAAYNPSGFGDPSPWPVIFCWQNADTNISGGDSDVLYGDLSTWRAYGTPATIQPANGGNVTPVPEEDIMATLADLKAALLDPDVLEAIGREVATRAVPHFDPATGKDDGHGTTAAAVWGNSDLQHVATRNAVAALAELVKASIPNADAAAQAAYDKFLADLKALNLHIGA